MPRLHLFISEKARVNPWQDKVCGHLADDAWIVPIAGQSPIRMRARRSTVWLPRFTLAFTKASIDAAELPVIMARQRPDPVSRYSGMLASWLGLIGIAIDDLDRPR